MIQGDDNIVEKKVREDAEFESLLNQELENAIRYNYGREIVWTFSVDLITYDGRKHTYTIMFNTKWIKTNIKDDFKAYVRKKIAEIQDMIERNKAAIKMTGQSFQHTKNDLCVKIQINLHNDTG